MGPGPRSQATLTLTVSGWTAEAEAALARICATDPTVSVAWFRREVEAERLGVISVQGDGDPVGVIFWRIEAGDCGSEFVVVAAAGALPGCDLVASVLPALEVLAAKAGCAWLRAHTARPGLVRKLAGLGFRAEEVVLRKELAHVA